MKLQTAITIRVAAAFIAFLIVIALNYPKTGTPLAIAWALLVLWMMARQRNQSE